MCAPHGLWCSAVRVCQEHVDEICRSRGGSLGLVAVTFIARLESGERSSLAHGSLLACTAERENPIGVPAVRAQSRESLRRELGVRNSEHRGADE